LEQALAAFSQEQHESLKIPSLDAEFNAMDVAALARGAEGKLPSAWLQHVGRHCDRQGQAARALRVHRVLPIGTSEGHLEPGDVVLSINNQPIACCFDVECALAPPLPMLTGRKGRSEAKAKAKAKGKLKAKPIARKPAAAPGAVTEIQAQPPGVVSIQVFRNGKEVTVAVEPTMLASQDEARLIMWAGLVLRSPPRCVFDRCGSTVVQHFRTHPGGVFVQRILSGSPAEARELVSQCFLVEIDGVPVYDLQDVLVALGHATKAGQSSAVAPAGQVSADVPRRWVRLRLMDLFGHEHARALQCDPLFFPTLDLQRMDSGSWQCRRLP